MIVLKQIKVNAKKVNNENKEDLIKSIIFKNFKLKSDAIKEFRIIKEALDARKKPEIFYIYNVALSLDKKKEAALVSLKTKVQIQIDYYNEQEYRFPSLHVNEYVRPLVVGSGPAGLFVAYMLAENGFKPILIERGDSINERKNKVNNYFENGILDKESNIQFGEGGAGTFSDGKLNTGTKDKLGMHKKVLDIFIKHGADKEIAYESKPHIGTDILEKIVVSMRNQIISNGGTVMFNKKLTGINIKNGKLASAVINDCEEIKTDMLVLAIGHSARDTFRMIYNSKLQMEQKPFAVGVRVIHEQEFINKSQYGIENDYLPPADYKITTHTGNGRNVYSFCMCPGGFVVPAASFEHECVVNGMSYSRRDGKYANSAIVVNVNSEDFDSDDIFAGMNFQEELEFNAYKLNNGITPVQSYKAFKECKEDTDTKELMNIASLSVAGKTSPANVAEIFPKALHEALCEGLLLSDKKFNDFSTNIKLITGVETRTSSPVKILRNEKYESNIMGIFPCGEGAGYAGGIMSAAVDGIRVATEVANRINGEN